MASIHDLPDEMLYQILSHLPLEDAVSLATDTEHGGAFYGLGDWGTGIGRGTSFVHHLLRLKYPGMQWNDISVKDAIAVDAALSTRGSTGFSDLVRLGLTDAAIAKLDDPGVDPAIMLVKAVIYESADVVEYIMKNLACELSHDEILHAIEHAIEFSTPGILETVLNHSELFDYDLYVVFRVAVVYGRVDMVKLLLDDYDVDPGAYDNQAIVDAVLNGETDMVEYLLALDDVNDGDGLDRTIIEASRLGDLGIVKLLAASPDVHVAAQHNQAIVEAARNGYLDVVEFLMSLPAADASDQHNWALIDASNRGDLPMVKLLASSEDVRESTSAMVALAVAMDNGHSEIADYLETVLGE